jgi:hypothetical protein
MIARFPPAPRQFLTISQKVKIGGGDVRKFEPVFALKALSYGRIDKIIRRLRLFYKENPASFEVPAFAQKVY